MRLTIPLDSLPLLPDGASYNADSGRAHVRASLRKASAGASPAIVIEADCDSLQRLVAYYENRLEQNQRVAGKSSSEDTARAEARQPSNGIRRALQGIIAGILIGIISTIITRRIWQKVF